MSTQRPATYRFARTFLFAVTIGLGLACPAVVRAQGVVRIAGHESRLFKTLPVLPGQTVPIGYRKLSCAEVLVSSPAGVVRDACHDGAAFLVVFLKLDPNPVAVGNRKFVRINATNIYLQDAQGNSLPPVGTCTWDGRFDPNFTGYNYAGPRPQTPRDYALVFAVNNRQTDFRLIFGKTSIAVDWPADRLQRPQIADAVSVALSSDVIDRPAQLQVKEKLGPFNRIQGEFIERVEGGPFLVLHLRIEPKKPNRGNQFVFATTDFTLQVTDELDPSLKPHTAQIPAIGYLDGKRKFHDGKHEFNSQRPLPTAPFDPIEVSLVFPVAERRIRLHYLHELVNDWSTFNLPTWSGDLMDIFDLFRNSNGGGGGNSGGGGSGGNSGN